MERPDYTFTLADITNRHGQGSVECIDHRANRQFQSQVTVRDDQLRFRTLVRMQAEIADLVDLASVVHVADRLSVRRNDMPCHIHVIVPLRRPDVFSTPAVRELLLDILRWYTEDHWTFDFRQRQGYGRPAEQALLMPYHPASSPSVEVALWSGGLDCLAGLCHRLNEAPASRFVLVGTGSSTFMYKAQQRIASALQSTIGRRNRITLVRVPIRSYETGVQRKNPMMRSRGFTFLLIGAACALLEGQSALHVYENGVGAINLPFRDSEVGLDHARSVHPLSLFSMSELVSQVLDTPFTFCQPFLFMTKAQLCTAIDAVGATAAVPETVSCDRRHRNQRTQCGYCSSCLLRRQAIAVQGIADETLYVVNSSYRLQRPDDAIYLRAMQRQVMTLRSILSGPDQWYSLCERYPVLEEIADQITAHEGIAISVVQAQLLQLYERYVQEWTDIQPEAERWLVRDSEIRAAG